MEGLQTFSLIVVFVLGIAFVTCNKEKFFPEDQCNIEQELQKLPGSKNVLYLEGIDYTLLTPTLWIATGEIGKESSLDALELLINNPGIGCSGEIYILSGIDGREFPADYTYPKGSTVKFSVMPSEGLKPEKASSVIAFYQERR